MNAGSTLRTARLRAGLTLRQLAARAATSHSTLSAYESGRSVPSVATLTRIVVAAGFELDGELRRRHRGDERIDKATELEAALALAEQFPARHSTTLDLPVFAPA